MLGRFEISDLIAIPEVEAAIFDRLGDHPAPKKRRKNHHRKPIVLYRMINDSDDHFFRFTLRVTRIGFERLCDIVEPRLERKYTTLSNGVQHHVVATIFYLRGNSMNLIAEFVGVSESTARNMIANTVNIINNLDFIIQPTDWAEVKARFADNGPFNDCIGAIDGTIIQIGHPVSLGLQRVCHVQRAKCAGLNVLAICDRDTRVWWLSTRALGSSHDSGAFQNIGGYSWIHGLRGETGNGYLLGDAGFMNCSSVITPFRDPAPDSREESFNKIISQSRIVVERLFGIVKGRFRILSRKVEARFQNIPSYITVCFSLHNFFLSMGDEDEEWRNQLYAWGIEEARVDEEGDEEVEEEDEEVEEEDEEEDEEDEEDEEEDEEDEEEEEDDEEEEDEDPEYLPGHEEEEEEDFDIELSQAMGNRLRREIMDTVLPPLDA